MIMKFDKVPRSRYAELVVFLESKELSSLLSGSRIEDGVILSPISIRDYQEESRIESAQAEPVRCQFTLVIPMPFLRDSVREESFFPTRLFINRIFDILGIFPEEDELCGFWVPS